MNKFNIGQEFSTDPSGRYYSDGPGSGEEFREEYLRKYLSSLKGDEKLLVILDDNVESYGSSFLVEGFAGMVKYGYMRAEDVLSKLEFEFKDDDFEFYKNKIIQYINEAKFNSKEYKPTQKL